MKTKQDERRFRGTEGVLALLATAAAALAVAGCKGVPTYEDPGGIVIYDAGPSGGPDGGIRPNRPTLTGEVAPMYGFISSAARVEYYYLGEVDKVGDKVPVNAIYFFYDEDGKPLFRLSEDGTQLVGWHPVVDVIPTRPGYSPFWKVVMVRVKGKGDANAIDALSKTVPRSEVCQMDAVCPKGKRCIDERCTDPIDVGVFPLDGIKSLATLEKNKLDTQETQMVLNCPVTDADAELVKGIAAADRPFPRLQLWYKRLKAFCYLVEGVRELIGEEHYPQKLLPPGKKMSDVIPPGPTLAQLGGPPKNAYFVSQELDFGGQPVTVVLARRNVVLTEHMPGTSGYTPLATEYRAVVDKDHTFKDIRSVAELKQAEQAGTVKIRDIGRLHNLIVRGTIPACQSDADCKETGGVNAKTLQCSLETGYCSPPFVRYGEECRREVKECDPAGGPGGTRLACVGLRVREKYFCFNACDSNTTDTNPDKDIDSRCGSVKGHRCFGLRQTDPTRPNGVCIHICDSKAADVIKECVSPTCANGKLEFGETCDDGNKTNGDGCNEFCSLSSYERCSGDSDCKGFTQGGSTVSQTCKEPSFGQGMTYCLPSKKEKDEREDNDKYRALCMEFNYCWPPDERADWLEKEDESQ